jgi:glycosyltransferase involved in cell wall biosynthesis
METISVVIPLYNKGPFIMRTINSVLNQTKLPGEIIVIDDGSTDGGGEIVDQMNNSLVRLVRQKNQGVSVARNVGISLAKGDLVACLDADDEWNPKFLETISEMRQLFPQAGAYATAYDIIDSQGRRKVKSTGILANGKHQLINNFFSVDPALIWISAAVVPKKVFSKVGLFKERDHFGEDLDMLLRIGIHYPVAFNNTILATYRQDATNRVFGVKKFYHEPVFSVTLSKVLKSGIVPPEKLPDLKEYFAYWQYWAVRHLISNNQRVLAINMINKTRGTKRYYRQGWVLLILAHLPPSVLNSLRKVFRYLFIENPFLKAPLSLRNKF